MSDRAWVPGRGPLKRKTGSDTARVVEIGIPLLIADAKDSKKMQIFREKAIIRPWAWGRRQGEQAQW